MLLFRHTDRRHGFTWETTDQPSARWHGSGDGPVQYLANTPDGAWAEFLRHEGIVDPADLDGIERRVWVVDVPDAMIASAAHVSVPDALARGGLDSYEACQSEARRLRSAGAAALTSASAALDDAAGYVSGGSFVSPGPRRLSTVYAVFGSGTAWTGWMCHDSGTPDAGLLPRVRQL